MVISHAKEVYTITPFTYKFQIPKWKGVIDTGISTFYKSDSTYILKAHEDIVPSHWYGQAV